MLGHRASRYNFSVPTNGGALLYNTSSGTLLRLGRGDGEELANVLSSPSMPFVDLASFPSEIAAALREGGFATPARTIPDGTKFSLYTRCSAPCPTTNV